MKQYNSTTLVRTIWSLLLVISALCLIPTTAEAQLSVSSKARPTIKGSSEWTGQITLSFSGGTAPYTVELTESPDEYRKRTTFTTSNPELVIYKLPQGKYKLKVTDATNAVQTVNRTVREVGVGINAFHIDAKWSQLHTAKAEDRRWISTSVFDTNTGTWYGYSCEIDTLAKYFDIAICTPNDYFHGYLTGQKDLNWLPIIESKTPPTFENDYGFWQVQDPIYDNDGKPTGRTIQKTHLFVRVPDNMLSANKMYYETAKWATSDTETEMIGLALRVKDSRDPDNSDFAYAKYMFDGRLSFDPNNWLEVTETKPEPCSPYRPFISIKKEAVKTFGLKFPVTVEVQNRAEGYGPSVLTLTFTEDNYTTPQTFAERDGGLSFATWNRIYMYDNANHDSSLGLNPLGLSLGEEKHEPHAMYCTYYRDSEEYRHWDDHKGWVLDPGEGNVGFDYCAGTRDVVYGITLWESFYGYSYKNSFANAEVTLLEAPPGYTPQNKYFPKLGEPVHISENHTSCDFFPFPNSEAPADNPYMAPCYDVKIPEGVYIFRIKYINVCGDELVFFKDVGHYMPFVYNAVQYKLSADAQDLKPQYEKVNCNTVRVYPFRGAKSRNLLLRNNESVPISVKVQQSASDSYYTRVINTEYFTYDPVRESKEPQDCYVELPWQNSTIEILYNYKMDFDKDLLSCLNQRENKLVIEMLGPTYDRDQLYTYICPSGKTAYVSVLPIRTAGETLVELRDVKDDTKVYASKTIPSKDQGTSVSFDLKDDQVQPEYSLYIKTGSGECAQHNGGEIIKMSNLKNSAFITDINDVKYCEGEKVKLECPRIRPESKYIWTEPDGTTQHEGRTITIPQATMAISGKWKLEITEVPCDGTPATQTAPFILSVAPPELWWRKDAKSADWNSFDNWADKDGEPIKAVPAKCTDVHLPGVVDNDNFYPNLDLKETKREFLGEPVCNDIYFHYGSALGQPHLLTHYSRAFIDYNFGIVQPNGSIQAHKDPKHPAAYDLLLERDRWYMVATPLKNVYAGDFSLGGYPLTYQRYLKVKHSGKRPSEASFEIPISRQGRLIADYNHALALKVEGYHSGKIGAIDHKNLNGLKGIIRLPYYENKERAPYYPRHKYITTYYWYDNDYNLEGRGDKTDSIAASTSFFGYFDIKDLKPVSKVDSVPRFLARDYRFLFEDDKTNAIGIIKLSNGQLEPGYAMKLSSSSKDSLFVMIGNPYMSPIHTNRFIAQNMRSNIEQDVYIFENGAWQSYKGTAPSKKGRNFNAIAPLQAFVVKLKNKDVSEICFPTRVLQDPNSAIGKKAKLRSADEDEESDEITERYVAVTVTDAEGGYTSALLLPEDTEESTPALIAPEGMQTAPLVYFISPTDSTCNFVQTNVDRPMVELGVFAPTDGMLTLDFTTLAEKPFDKLALYDRLRGTEQDLLVNPTYSYGYSERDGRRFELRMSYGNIRYEEQQDHQPDLAIERTATGYRIAYDQGIASYQLYSVQGYLLERATTDGQTHVDIEMPETDVVLLDVQSADGLRWIKKLQR